MEATKQSSKGVVANTHILSEELYQTLQNGTNEQYLDTLARASLVPHLTECIFVNFRLLAPEICVRWQKFGSPTEILCGFARIISCFPNLADYATQVFTELFANDDCISDVKLPSRRNKAADDQLIRVLLAMLRLLQHDVDRFSRFIQHGKLHLFLQHKSEAVRYLTVRLIACDFFLPERALEHMLERYVGQHEAKGDYDGKEIDYKFWSLWEEERVCDFTNSLAAVVRKQNALEQSASRTDQRQFDARDFSSNVTYICGILFPPQKNIQNNATTTHKFSLVPTTTTRRNMKALAEGLLNPHPVLITGISGAGKSSIINQVSQILQKNQSMVVLHPNEQSDAKLLMGLYVSGATTGSFEWRPGVLTTAVREGRWVVIEDLDRAPNDIISTLLPLLERRELRLPNRDEVIKAAGGFRIIATIRTESAQAPNLDDMHVLGARLWRKLHFEAVEDSEVEEIIRGRFPILQKFVQQILNTFNGLTQRMASHRLRANSLRTPSLRELLRWCGRMQMSLNACGANTEADGVPSYIFDWFFLDAVDCFLGSATDDQIKQDLVAYIAEALNISPKRKDFLLTERAPEINRYRQRATGATNITIGRALLTQKTSINAFNPTLEPRTIFTMTNHALKLLERVSAAVASRETLLLVGETGIGKTAALQHLAHLVGQDLLVLNLSQQSEATDIIGGFKPIGIRQLVVPLFDAFNSLFDASSFSRVKNASFLDGLRTALNKGRWKDCVESMRAFAQSASNARRIHQDEQVAKKPRLVPEPGSWLEMLDKIETISQRVSAGSGPLSFTFVESDLIRAVRNGGWVLLDEINLTTPDTLEVLSDLLDSGGSSDRSIILAESGTSESIQAHADFRIFAAMNPATDVGKRELPEGIRTRFTEIYVGSPDGDISSLCMIAESYLEHGPSSASAKKLARAATELFSHLKKEANEGQLVDGVGLRPHYSLRTFTRALAHARDISASLTSRRALYEGFLMCFATSLDSDSFEKVTKDAERILWEGQKLSKSDLHRPCSRLNVSGTESVESSYTISYPDQANTPESKSSRKSSHKLTLPRGSLKPVSPEEYIITPYIHRNVQHLFRAIISGRYPVLIQGPTSAGKTSMIQYLAMCSGNQLVRINNHEHTELQEYLGSYVSTDDGKLVFQDGMLVKALREGSWVILDELNLAPTDVLEALNRLLDDNRELLVPETQEVVKPHPRFMLFATQNPAGAYGGRKVLSRAFQNRFLELHFDDIPVEELNVILAERSKLPKSWCTLIVQVYKELSQLRQEDRLFQQDGFATLRDLFRWTGRGATTIEELALNGYMLLAEKARKDSDREAVRLVIEKVMSRKGTHVNIEPDRLYEQLFNQKIQHRTSGDSGIVWTKAMKRLYVLLTAAIAKNEPVLLIGETGCGKTTICQTIAADHEKELFILNAHQNTETGDMIGSQRPLRDRDQIEEQLVHDLNQVVMRLDGHVDSSRSVDELLQRYDSLKQNVDNKDFRNLRKRIGQNRKRRSMLFEWHDGSIVKAMRSGSFFMLDEISLAEDSVLERLNSVLDPQRTLVLTEKGSNDNVVIAQEGFQFLATMNPGGDYGKKELSPALRNRFTEIWVPSSFYESDVLQIVRAKLPEYARQYADVIVKFAHWFTSEFQILSSGTISIRDLLSWIECIGAFRLPALELLVQGAATVFIDTIGANPSGLVFINNSTLLQQRSQCLKKLSEILQTDIRQFYNVEIVIEPHDTKLMCGHFPISYGGPPTTDSSFYWDAPTTRDNAVKIARAFQINKPILLEGDAGVGKSSIVAALASATGRKLVRINLSEQTDLMDLFGSDVPVEGASAGTFTWRDAPFLKAMKNGNWVLLDEMNLATQSILEGLNSCLDHRGEAYIAELGRTFPRHPEFRLFAAQNPHHQGAGRKGLPASFVNRFTIVYIDSLRQTDLSIICLQEFPTVDASLIDTCVTLTSKLENDIVKRNKYGTRGSPWEINLRDILRLLSLISSDLGLLPAGDARSFAQIMFAARFRDQTDVAKITDTIHAHLSVSNRDPNLDSVISTDFLQVGFALLDRQPDTNIAVPARSLWRNLQGRSQLIQALMTCIQMSWPTLLVGGSGQGKTFVVELLASYIGVELITLPLDSSTDSNDLIGSYEQVDPVRDVRRTVEQLKNIVCSILKDICVKQNIPQLVYETSITILKNLSVFLKQPVETILKFCGSSSLEDLISRLNLRGTVEHEMQHELLSNFSSLHTQSVAVETSSLQGARFEWIDGTLLKAIEGGSWIVLDNANLCGPSTLDRLNSLLEPNGYLLVNEHQQIGEEPRVVRPHRNFRIFLTMDPQHGEVSRAMRNRCVELYVEPCTNLRDSFCQIQVGFQETSLSSLSSALYALRNISCDTNKSLNEWNVMSKVQSKDRMILTRFAEQIMAGLGSYEFSANFKTVCHTLCSRSGSSSSSISAVDASKYFQKLCGQLQSLETLANQSLVMYRHVSDHEMEVESHSMVQSLVRRVTELRDYLHASVSTTASHVGIQLELAISMLHHHVQTLHPRELSGNRILDFLSRLKMIHFYFLAGDTFFKPPLRLSALSAYLEYGQKLFGASLTSLASATVASLIEAEFPNESTDSGLAMADLWRHFLPSHPKSLVEITETRSLETRINKFHSRVWNLKSEYAQVQQVFSSLVSVLEDIKPLVGPANGNYQGIEAALENIPDSETSLLGETQPSFRREFELLRSYQHLIFGIAPDSSLQLLGGPTTELFRGRRNASQPLQFIDPIVRLSFIESSDVESLRAVLQCHSTLFSSLNKAKNIQIKDIALCRNELKILASSVANRPPCTTSLALHAVRQRTRSLGKVLYEAIIYESTDNSETPAHISYASENLSKEAKISRIMNDFISVHLKRSNEMQESVRNVYSALGKEILDISIGALKLFVPDTANDPADLAHIELKIYSNQKQDLRDNLDSIGDLERLLTGFDANLQTRLIEKQLHYLRGPSVTNLPERPETMNFEGLQTVFDSILNIVGRATRGEDMLYPGILRDVSQVMDRLHKDWYFFDDTVTPLLCFLSCLKLALAVSIDAAQGNASIIQQGGREATIGLPFFDTRAQIDSTLNDRKDVSRKVSSKSKVLRYLRLLSMSTNVLGDRSHYSPTIITQAFDHIYEVWKDQDTAQLEREAKQAKFYKYRGDDEGDEDAIETQELGDLFPNSVEVSESTENSKIKDEMANRSQTARLGASLHIDLFQGKDNSQSLTKYLENKLPIYEDWYDFQSEIQQSPPELIFPLLVMSLHQKQHHIKLSESKRINIYRENSMFEIEKVCRLANGVQRHFEPLALLFPEQTVIQNALAISAQLLKTEHNEPLMRVLNVTETLHSTVVEWQKVTSREYRVDSIQQDLTNLLVSWRQLELQSWTRLLDDESSRCHEEALKWWVTLYENVMIHPKTLVDNDSKNTKHLAQLLSVLQMFYRNSTVGEYLTRLELCKSLLVHLELCEGESDWSKALYHGVKNMLNHMSRHASTVQNSILSKKRQLEGEVSNVLQQTAWKDRNITELHQNAIRARRALFRVVKKYREFMASPVDTFLKARILGFSDDRTEEPVQPQDSCIIINQPSDSVELKTTAQIFVPQRLLDAERTASNVRRKLSAFEDLGGAESQLKTFLHETKQTVDELRRDTPKIATKDNVKTIKHLLRRKRRAFADTLKELSKMGFKADIKSEILVSQSSTSSILASVPSLESHPECDTLFHNILDVFDKIRQTDQPYANDLSKHEISRCLGILHSMLAHIIQQRREVSILSEHKRSLDVQSKQILNLSANKSSLVKLDSQEHFQELMRLRRTLSWLPSIAKTAAELLHMQAEMGGLDFTEIVNHLIYESDQLRQLHVSLAPDNLEKYGIIDSDLYQQISKAASALENFIAQQKIWTEKRPEAKPILDHVVDWADTHEAQPTTNGHTLTSNDISQVSVVLVRWIDEALASVQDLEKITGETQLDYESATWLVENNRQYRKLHTTFRIPRFTSSLSRILESLSNIHSEDMDDLTWLFRKISPIWHEYSYSYLRVIKSYTSLHNATCRLALQMAETFNEILQHGFCKPSEEAEDSGGANGKVEGGTGLGEGEGATDISKTLNDDEDLSELADQGNNQNGGDPLESHDDALDVDNTLSEAADQVKEADAEDSKKQEDQESDSQLSQEDELRPEKTKGGEGSENETNQMDDGLGEVDDLEPSAVDEKMWDEAGKGDDEAKQMEGRQKTEGEHSEELSAAQEQQSKNRNEKHSDRAADDDDNDNDDEDGKSVSSSASADDIREGGTLDPYLKSEDVMELPDDLEPGNKTSEDDDSDEDMQDGSIADDDLQLDAQADDFEYRSQDGSVEDMDEDEERKEPVQDQAEAQTEANEDGNVENAEDFKMGGVGDGTDETERQDEADKGNSAGKASASKVKNTHVDNEPVEEIEDQLDGDAQEPDNSLANGKLEPATGGYSRDSVERRNEPPTSDNLQKLGDALERYHAGRKQIHEATSPDAERGTEKPNLNVNDTDFQHVREDDEQDDAQALGPSIQARPVDPEAAILDSTEQLDQDEDPPLLEVANSEGEISEDNDVEMQDDSLPSKGAQADISTEQISRRGFTPDVQPGHLSDELDEIDEDDKAEQDHIQPEKDVFVLRQSVEPPIKEDAAQRWRQYELATHTLSLALTEQLRLILAPTVATKLRGDFRTGKRLNMKRIIPYIASSYKRDKIWMRRSIPSKRAYQVLLAVDDSRSMAERGTASLAFQTLALVAKSLSMLEVGDVSIVGFGDDVITPLEFGSPFTSEAGTRLIQDLRFEQNRTNVQKLLSHSIDVLTRAKTTSRTRGTSNADLWQLEIVVSDGDFDNHDSIRRLLMRAREERIMVVFVIVDAAKVGHDGLQKSYQSIFDMKRAEFRPGEVDEDGVLGEGSVQLTHYMDTFPFPYYLVVKDVNELPAILCAALRQWFAEIAER